MSRLSSLLRGRGVRLLTVAVGLSLLVVLILRNDPGALFASLSQLSWRIVVAITLPYALVNAFDTLAWRVTFRHNVAPFETLFSARLVGSLQPHDADGFVFRNKVVTLYDEMIQAMNRSDVTVRVKAPSTWRLG